MKKRTNKADIQNEKTPLDEIAGLTKNNGNLKVPEGYFDLLPGRIHAAIRNDQDNSERKSKTQSLDFNYKFWIPLLAAASLVIALIVYSPFGEQKNNYKSMVNDTLNKANTYDASYASDLLADDLSTSEQLLESMPDDAEINFGYTPVEGDTLVEEAILDYLKNQELDTELLAQLEQ